jgi:hypothetical protein
MAASPDPIYWTAVDFRLLYTLAELGSAYFRVRGLPWEGEKKAIRYWTDHDPDYLALFKQGMAATNREEKLQLYEQLAVLTLVPIGALWDEGVTAIQFEVKPDEELSPGMVGTALAFWENLLT